MNAGRCPNCNSLNKTAPNTVYDGYRLEVHLGSDADDIRKTRNKILSNNSTVHMYLGLYLCVCGRLIHNKKTGYG